MYTVNECEQYKSQIRKFVNGHGKEVYEAMIAAITDTPEEAAAQALIWILKEGIDARD